MNFILWVFAAAFWAGAYFLGLYICKKFRKLKNNVNLVSIIIASLIAVPMVMQIKTKPITYAIGYSIVAPFLITTLVSADSDNTSRGTATETVDGTIYSKKKAMAAIERAKPKACRNAFKRYIQNPKTLNDSERMIFESIKKYIDLNEKSLASWQKVQQYFYLAG